MSEMLYGAKGSVWTFLDGPAKSFVKRDAQGYAAYQKLGFQPQFDDGFLPFVNRAAARQRDIAVFARSAEAQKEQTKVAEQRRELESQGAKQDLQKRLKEVEGQLAELRQQQEKIRTATYPVTVHALPTNANTGAKAHPHATLLTVQCAPEPRTITNYNFPVSATFNWSAQACGDVTLSIRIEDLVLNRVYPGARGMVAFATEFRDGERRFGPDDFPVQRAALDALGVKTISVRYQLGGQLPLLRQADQLADMTKKEGELAAERRKLAARLDALDQFALREKGDTLERQSREIAEKERTLTEPATPDDGVPRRIAVCWKPGPEWLLTRAPTREIPPPAAKPAPAPVQQQSGAEGDFQIQLGAFGPEHSQRILAALRRDGVDADVQKVERSVEPWYRVRVGRYPSREEAQRALDGFNARYRVSGAVVRHEPGFRKATDVDLDLPPAPPPGKSGFAPDSGGAPALAVATGAPESH
jgi:hypothetical protein